MSCLLSCRSHFALTAQAAHPTTGSIFKENVPPPALLQSPSVVIAIPTPRSPALNSSVKIAVRTLFITGNTLLPAAVLELLAIAGFHSNTRHEVHYQHIKGFGEHWGDEVKAWSTTLSACLKSCLNCSCH